MPAILPDIRPFVDRLLRDPGALMTDEAFVRSFNALGLPLRRAIMERVEAARRHTAVVDLRPAAAAWERIARVTPTEPAWEQSLEAEYQEPSPPYRTDEENARLDRIAQMRRDMAWEIEEFRGTAFRRYQQLPSNQQTLQVFQAWDRNVELGVAGIRERWEQRIADQEPRPTPPVVTWPDPAEYRPNGRYATQRSALSAFTRAVNGVHAGMVQNTANAEACERVHINGSLVIREAWRGWQEMPRIPDPPPTTTPWPAPEPEVDELDIMLKHLPRNGRFVLVTATWEAAVEIQQKVNAQYTPNSETYAFRVSMLARNTALLRAIRDSVLPVFIDPSVFKMHAARQGDWSEADLDALIELQGEIPDEETT